MKDTNVEKLVLVIKDNRNKKVEKLKSRLEIVIHKKLKRQKLLYVLKFLFNHIVEK